MRLKDVVVDEVYAAVNYYRREKHSRELITNPRNNMSWDELMRDMYPARVVELRVEHHYYKTPGVLTFRLDPQTMDRATWRYPGQPDSIAKNEVMRAVQLVMPWKEWLTVYHEREEEEQAAAIRRAEKNKLRESREQERAAKQWMESEFAKARSDIYDVMTVVNGPFGDGWRPRDEDVERLVVRRHPDGNPYLNGRYEA